MSKKTQWLEDVKADAIRLTQKRFDDNQAELEAGRKRDEALAKTESTKKESK
jgi:hypothetical protein